MKKLLIIVTSFTCFTFYGQNPFSKDILINKSIFEVMNRWIDDYVITKEKMDTIYFVDETLGVKEHRVASGALEYSYETKDTLIRNVVLKSVAHTLPFSKKRNVLYVLHFEVINVKEFEITVSYRLGKVTKVKNTYHEEYLQSQIVTFATINSLLNQLKLEPIIKVRG
ncbi:MAG: hypothetical protein ACYDCN_00080 [Bacteroidia bacterium]